MKYFLAIININLFMIKKFYKFLEDKKIPKNNFLKKIAFFIGSNEKNS